MLSELIEKLQKNSSQLMLWFLVLLNVLALVFVIFIFNLTDDEPQTRQPAKTKKVKPKKVRPRAPVNRGAGRIDFIREGINKGKPDKDD